MNQSRVIKTSRDGFLSFCIATCIFFILHRFHNVAGFPFDSSEYWRLSDPGVFLNFPKVIRGFFYPFLLLPAHYLSNILVGYELYPYRIFSSLMYGYLLTNILPSVYQQLFGGKLALMRRLVPPILVAILFPGLIIYPLSDLPAFILFICALHLLWRARAEGSLLRALGFAVLAGIFAAGAYNTRTIYIFPLLCVFCAVPLYFFSIRLITHRILGIAAFVLGVAVLGAPQSFINHARHGTWTPLVITQSTGNSLFALQLMWGITMQRYETTIDPSASTPTRYFIDRAGEKLFVAEELEKSQATLGNYMDLVAKHPVEFVGIYARHLVSGLDVRDGDVYVKDIRADNTKIVAFNFLVVALALLIALIRYMFGKSAGSGVNTVLFSDRASANPVWPLWLLIWLLPIFSILPGAVETRFFFPLHVLLYCTIAFNISVSELAAVVKMHWILVLCGMMMLGTMYFGISTSTQAALQSTIPLSYRFGN